MPPETNPRMAFERLFGADDVPLDAAARARRLADGRSVLDVVLGRGQALARELGPSDRRKLDEYLGGVREIERQIERAEKDSRELEAPFEKPAGMPDDFAEYVRLMFDLQLAAFQADLTRLSTFMVGREGSLQSYPEIGVPDSHHPLTHHRGQPDLVERVTKINTFPWSCSRTCWQAPGDARGRRDAPRPRRRRLRQRARGRRPPHPRGFAGAAGGRGERQDRGRPPSRLPAGDADDQPLPDAARSHRGRGGVARRQHGAARPVAGTLPAEHARFEQLQ
jgi:hypothetical protein